MSVAAIFRAILLSLMQQEGGLRGEGPSGSLALVFSPTEAHPAAIFYKIIYSVAHTASPLIDKGFCESSLNWFY